MVRKENLGVTLEVVLFFPKFRKMLFLSSKKLFGNSNQNSLSSGKPSLFRLFDIQKF